MSSVKSQQFWIIIGTVLIIILGIILVFTMDNFCCGNDLEPMPPQPSILVPITLSRNISTVIPGDDMLLNIGIFNKYELELEEYKIDIKCDPNIANISIIQSRIINGYALFLYDIKIPSDANTGGYICGISVKNNPEFDKVYTRIKIDNSTGSKQNNS